MIKKVTIFTNNDLSSLKVKKKLISKLKKNGFIIDDENFNLSIAIGGDGTFLEMIRNNHFNRDVYYIGINTGTLGFAQEIYPKELDRFLDSLNEKNYKKEEISIGKVVIKTKNNSFELNFLNEILIRDNNLKTIHLDVLVDKEILESFVGDGLLLSTSFGSTAYNLSFGGSIVYNDLSVLQLTPIAPIYNKSYKSLRNSVIIPSKRKIYIIPKLNNSLLITLDGISYCYDDIISIKVLIEKKKIKCLRMHNYDYTRRINEKFVKD